MKTATQSSADVAATHRAASRASILHRLRHYQAINVVVVYGLIVVGSVTWSLLFPEQLYFATEGNLTVLARQIPITGIAAIGVGLLMISGEFDISVAGTFTLVPFVVAITFSKFGWALPLAFMAGLAVAIAIGTFNGLITTRFGVPSFITTLGTMFILRGIVRFVSINPITNQPDSLAFFPGDAIKATLTGNIAGPLQAQIVWLLVAALFGYLLLNRHQIGNQIFAAGGNRDAALAVGVPVSRVKMIAFIISAVGAGFAGLLQAARINEIEPSFATLSGFELKAIAAVVVGGVSLYGGRGAILGMVLGAALIETVDNLLVLVSAPETLFKGFLGAVIIVAVILNVMISGRRRA